MIVYFVRHGETLLNTHHQHQYEHTPLRADKIHVVGDVAKALATVEATYLLTSPYTRSLETARIIGMKCGLNPVVEPLFSELKRPSILLGRSHFSARSLWYVLCSIVFRNNYAWRYRDGESISDLNNRALRARGLLEGLSKQHARVIVVSHTVFINTILMHLCDNAQMTCMKLFRLMLLSKQLKNGEVRAVEYTPTSPDAVCAWVPQPFPSLPLASS